MRAIQRVLFPTDFSAIADEAWPYATTLARDFGAELHLLHVLAPPPQVCLEEALYVRKDLAEKLRADAEASLERLTRSARELGLTAQRHLRTGTAVHEILEYAHGHDIDVMVMGTQGRTGLAHTLNGSVAERVVRRAPCPLFIVRHRIPAPPSLLFRRILVPLDGSPLGEAILPYVVELAKHYQAMVLFLRVTGAHPFPRVNPVEARVGAVADAVDQLTEMKRSLALSGPAAECVVRCGRAPREILDHARQQSVDLIAMFTHGRSGLRRAALGSVAETVLRSSHVPVFLLPRTAVATVGTEDATGRAAREVA